MKPEVVFYSRSVLSSDGTKHEFGIQGYIEEGETLETAYQQAQEKVTGQLEAISVQGSNSLVQNEIKSKLESALDGLKDLAKQHGIELEVAPKEPEVPEPDKPIEEIVETPPLDEPQADVV